MRIQLQRLWESGKESVASQADQALEQPCAGRVVSALAFIVVILCIGLWITVFLILKDRLFTQTLPGNMLTNITCFVFFGGLVLALFIGALMGNFLRRTFWMILVKRNK